MKKQAIVESAPLPARERILHAAMESFMELGYTEASTLKIATRAQVSKRELYALFGSKQAMLAACIADRAGRMLKIDQAFIRELDRDTRSATICDAIIALGKSLGIRVIAEGIERRAQYEWLYRHGCDGAQGFYLGRPERLTEFMARWRQAPAIRST